MMKLRLLTPWGVPPHRNERETSRRQRPFSPQGTQKITGDPVESLRGEPASVIRA